MIRKFKKLTFIKLSPCRILFKMHMMHTRSTEPVRVYGCKNLYTVVSVRTNIFVRHDLSILSFFFFF